MQVDDAKNAGTPEPTVERFDMAPDPAPVYPYQTVQDGGVHAAPPPPVDIRMMTSPQTALDPGVSLREEIRERRRRERETGVPFVLPDDQIEVRVRLLNLHERNTLVGMPDELRDLMLRGFNEGTSDLIPEAGKRTEDDMLRVMGMEEEAANAACLVGFVRPRLEPTREQADAFNDPWVWALEDVTVDDRKAYFALISGQNEEAMTRIRAFQRGERVGG